MSLIRGESRELRTAAPPASSQVRTPKSEASSQDAKSDQVLLHKPEEKGESRPLPDLAAAWSEAVGAGASNLADRVTTIVGETWDTVSGALGFKRGAGTSPAKGPSAPPESEGPEIPSDPASEPVRERRSENAPQTVESAKNRTGEETSRAAEMADAEAQENRPSKPTLQGLPPRPEDARGGKEFMRSIKHLPPGPERDKAVLDEILKGNVPDGSRELQEVTVTRQGKEGKTHEITMNVMPDYLSIGSDQDNVRIPMTPAVAQAIADKTGTSLPTDRMVDDIHSQAKKLHLDPFQWKPGNEHAKTMQSLDYYQKHDERIDTQLGSGQAQRELLSGHKKDLVIPAKDGKVAIYGGAWPGTGKRVQPYSNKHEAAYEDYSHGVRLVSQDIVIDGRTVKLQEALADPTLAPLLTRFPPGSDGNPPGYSNRYPTPTR